MCVERGGGKQGCQACGRVCMLPIPDATNISVTGAYQPMVLLLSIQLLASIAPQIMQKLHTW